MSEKDKTAKRSFTVNISSDTEKVFNKVKKAVENQGGKVEGTTKSGKISVKGVELGYKRKGQKVTVEIKKKPWYASNKRVEKEVRKFFPKKK